MGQVALVAQQQGVARAVLRETLGEVPQRAWAQEGVEVALPPQGVQPPEPLSRL